MLSSTRAANTYRSDGVMEMDATANVMFLAALYLKSFISGSKIHARIFKRLVEQTTKNRRPTKKANVNSVFKIKCIHGTSLSWEKAETLIIEMRLNSAPFRRSALDFEDLLHVATEFLPEE